MEKKKLSLNRKKGKRTRRVLKNTFKKTKKYINKNILKGGASNYIFSFSRKEFLDNYTVNNNNLILFNDNKSFTDKFNDLTKHLINKLDNLLTLTNNNNEVNLEFINEIYSFPYLDVNGLFTLKKTINGSEIKPTYEFLNDKHNIYKVKMVLSTGTGSGDILLLEKKESLLNKDDYPSELVLKIYNNTGNFNIKKNNTKFDKVNEYNKNFIEKEEIKKYEYPDYKSYSSLEIFDISKDRSKFSNQNNYHIINIDDFLSHNYAFKLNNHNCLINKYNFNNPNNLHTFNNYSNNNNYNNNNHNENIKNVKLDIENAMRDINNIPSSIHSSKPSPSPSSKKSKKTKSKKKKSKKKSSKTSSSANASDNASDNVINSKSHKLNMYEYTPKNEEELKHTLKKEILSEYMYLSTANNDFFNEFIQQLIIYNILNKYKENHGTDYTENIMKFYNTMVIPVVEDTTLSETVNYYGCILMEKIDGNLRDYLISSQNENESESNKIKMDKLSTCVNTINDMLLILKNKDYCFNHSDLKIENVFYRKTGGTNIKFILADYDKSSITFNKIRFYNNKFQLSIRDYFENSMGSSVFKINVKQDNKKLKFEKKGEVTLENIQIEQLYLRYSPFPTFSKYDIIMFIASIFFNDITLINNLIRNKGNLLATKYKKLLEKIINITSLKVNNLIVFNEIYSRTFTKGYNDYNGNYVKLFFNCILTNSFNIYYEYDNSDSLSLLTNKNINLLILTENNKINVSRPLTIDELNNDKFNLEYIESKRTFIGNKSVEYRYTYNYNITNEPITIHIFYTGNVPKLDNTKKIIFKTNRYSSLKLAYEWDYIRINNKTISNNQIDTFWNYTINSINSITK